MGRKAKKRRTWFTADLHFGHANIIRYCKRPFSCVADMNHAMIDDWNSVVAPEDTVYCLGDFTLETYAQQYFTQLQGHIHIIPGGHDKRWIRKGPCHSATNRLVEILPPLFSLRVSKTQHIVLCHYPLESWNGRAHGSWHLHGHSHGRSLRVPWRIDMGVDCHNFFPISLGEVEETMNTHWVTIQRA